MPRDEFECIQQVVSEVGAEQPLTAREICQLLEENGVEVDSAHRVATILGRRARQGEVEVIRDQPYRYRFDNAGQ